MSNDFFEASKKTTNDFLQSIVFIDDQAYSNEPNEHAFNALEISTAFAAKEKICAIYQPCSASDVKTLTDIAKKADVVVVDWRMQFEDVTSQSGEEEEYVEEEDLRGKFSKQIVKQLLEDPLYGSNSLKLVVVYTGESDLKAIANSIYESLRDFDGKGLRLDSNETELRIGNFIIQVRGKDNRKTEETEEEVGEKFKHNPDLKKYIVNYEDMPEYILNEYTKLTSGLLSNFVISALTILRRNTSYLINLFNNDLDRALLFHRVMLPLEGDIEELLVDMFTGSVHALLHYNLATEAVSDANFEAWIKSASFSRKEEIAGKELAIDQAFVLNCFQSGFIEAVKSAWGKEPSKNENKKIESAYNNLNKNYPKIFEDNRDSTSNERFSILTHHKSNLKQPSMMPRLSLGSIIKEKSGERYFLCIQARCDSVRIEEERRFVFRELFEVEGTKQFQLLIEHDEKFKRLRIAKEAYGLRTIKFPSDSSTQVVKARNEKGKFIFSSIYEEEYLWIADLKDTHAQRVANNFAAKISRVGLDESEWLRKWALSKNDALQ